MLTPEQIENTRVAYSIMAGVPAKHIELGLTRRVPAGRATDKAMKAASCGTVGCIFGWLSAHPYFKKRGCVSLWSDLSLFGATHIFDGGDGGIDGKREALRRLRDHLYDNDAITYARSRQLCAREQRMRA